MPARLIDEFVDIAKGLLANVALGCIAAIREDTHRVLARFHSGMDAPYLTHRILLSTPEDAEDYAVDLLGSEFLAVLEGRMIGARYAGRQAIQLALSELGAQNVVFRLMTAKASAKNAKTVTVEDLMKLVDSGPAGLARIPNVSGGRGQQDKLHERLYLLLSEDLENGIAVHHEFARASAHIREQAAVDSDYRATLGLGSIVRRGAEYLVCIQPSCDALRLRRTTQFIFASLTSANSVFDVVVREPAGANICLKLNAQASTVQTAPFDPDQNTGRILTVARESGQAFVSTAGEEFIWVCDLRTLFAQRFAHRIAQNLSRVGLDEFEWQRRHLPVV